MILAWSCPPPPIRTQWRGLDDETLATLPIEELKALAAIVGPQGEKGLPGRDGAAQIPPVIDGGNF